MIEHDLNAQKINLLRQTLLRAEIEKHFQLQKLLTGNNQLDLNTIVSHFNEGVDLWNNIIVTVLQKYKDGEAIIFRRRPMSYDLTLYDGFKKSEEIFRLPNEAMHTLIRRGYVWCANQYSKQNPEASAYLAVGEGASLLHGANDFIRRLNGFANNQNGIKFIAGPIMVCESDDMLNGFVSSLVQNKKRTALLTLYKNRLLPFTPLYAGYFHCYLAGSGDTILVETPHGFTPTPDEERYQVIFNCSEIASRLRQFLDTYIKSFTVSMVITDEHRHNTSAVSGFYSSTADTRTQRYDKDGIIKALKEKSYQRMIRSIQ